MYINQCLLLLQLEGFTVKTWPVKFIFRHDNDIFGLKNELAGGNEGGDDIITNLMELILDIRQSARANKDWGTSDKIRDALKEAKIVVKDGKDGSSWTVGS